MPENDDYREVLEILDVMVDLQDRLTNADSDDWDFANEQYKEVLPTIAARASYQRKLRKYQEEAGLLGLALGIAIPDWRTVTPRIFHSVLIPIYGQVAALRRIEPDWED